MFDMFGPRTIYKTKLAFIGLGKLGMPCAEAFVKKGFDVSGYDVAELHTQFVTKFLSIEGAVKDRDIIFIAVPTPHEDGYDGRTPTSHLQVKDFNYKIVKDILKKLNKILTPQQTVVLISTVLPGTIRREFAELLDHNVLLYNPYLIAMGTVETDVLNPEMIMIGSDGLDQSKHRVEMLENFYNQVCENYPRVEKGTWEEMESMKIFYNTFISNKLSLVNMIQDVANKLGHMDVDKVTKGLANSTKRITSSAYMKAGMGDGGACHPRDNIALRWLAKELNLGYDLFESIMSAREKQAENMAKEILKHGINIAFSSNSYKPGTDLIDGSYSLLVQHYVKKYGGQIVDGSDIPVQVIVRVHETDNIITDSNTIIFDPWRSYPAGDNVVHYGKDSKIFMSGK
jgi:UDPglucose 6-dehydrogenase